MIPSNAGGFKARNTERLGSACDNLRAAISEIEAVCAELRPNSTLYLVLLGQIVPKIQALLANSSGKIALLDIIQLLDEADALE